LETVFKSSLYGIPFVFLFYLPVFFLPMLFNYFFDLSVILASATMLPRAIQYMRLRSDKSGFDQSTLATDTSATLTARPDAPKGDAAEAAETAASTLSISAEV
jgi:hypothetical protein